MPCHEWYVHTVYTQKREISLTHIESRPSKDTGHYDFFIDCVIGSQIEAAINDLQALSRNVTVLTRNVDGSVADTGTPSTYCHFYDILGLVYLFSSCSDSRRVAYSDPVRTCPFQWTRYATPT